MNIIEAVLEKPQKEYDLLSAAFVMHGNVVFFEAREFLGRMLTPCQKGAIVCVLTRCQNTMCSYRQVMRWENTCRSKQL